MIPLENKPLQTLYQIQLVLSKKISLPHDSPRLITLYIHERLCTALSSNALCFTEKLMPLLTVVSILLIADKNYVECIPTLIGIFSFYQWQRFSR